MRKRSIANLLSRNCRRGRDKKWKLPGRPQLRRAYQFQKERKRHSLRPSFQFFNQRLDRVGASTIRWQHQWLRARCVLRAVRWDDKSCAEFWEEFSEAAAAADNYCRGACVRRLLYSIQWLRTITTALKRIAGRLRTPGDLNVAWTISTARQPGLRVLSLRPWPPSLARRWPTSCT